MTKITNAEIIAGTKRVNAMTLAAIKTDGKFVNLATLSALYRTTRVETAKAVQQELHAVAKQREIETAWAAYAGA